MKLGIKVGLKNDSYSDLLIAKPDFCEMWFHSGKIPQYDDLFAKIKSLGIECNLHFWGALEDTTLCNLAYPDRKILAASIDLVKKTIDTAATHKSWYVNVHPGSAQRYKVDFSRERYVPYGEYVSFARCAEILKESLEILTAYATKQGVQLLVESVPTRAIDGPWYGSEGRKTVLNLGELPLEYVKPSLELENLYFTHDFGHTAGNIISDDRDQIVMYLFDSAKELAAKTKLIHVSYIIPPYNGTDYHGCLYYEEFKTPAAVPNFDETKQLLSIFKNQDDFGALVEPETDHPRNFEYLKRLVTEIA